MKLSLLLLALFVPPAMAADTLRFDFTHTSAGAAPGYTAVRPDMAYSAARGFGFEPVSPPAAGGHSPVPGTKPFFFSADVPEGNVAVTVTFGPGTNSVKAELRRLMVENVVVPAGQTATRTFVVNTRTPVIAAANGVAAGVVDLKAPRETVQEAWNWDRRLTLELHGAVRTIDIKPVQVPTIYLLGDSTVCDQPGEPYASWGQMLPRFFKPGIAVANHGESGETYRDSLQRRRLDKIVSLLKPGDTVLLQFGHNDQKQMKDNQGGPFTTYKDEIRQHVQAIRSAGGVPVIVSPMERRRFTADGKPIPTLADYTAAAHQAADELGTPFIDLNAKSLAMYAAWGVEGSQAAFALPEPDKLDNTHHNNYGSYELAKAVAGGMREAKLAAAAFIVDDFAFDPARPDPVAMFAVPASPAFRNERPLGDEGNR